jgi:hypothetical protein
LKTVPHENGEWWRGSGKVVNLGHHLGKTYHGYFPGFRIYLFLWIRIHHFRLNADPDLSESGSNPDPDPIWIQGFDDQKFPAENFLNPPG